jgi:serine/threonine protein kinase
VDEVGQGQQLGRFVLEQKLGAGTYGTVWRARDTSLGETVAIKILHAHLASEATALERLKREVVLARRISSPHVCRLFDLHEVDGHTFITMELIEGESLVERLKRQPLPFAHTNIILHRLIGGMAAAHAGGVIHRDIKPSNILLRPATNPTSPPTPVLLDFGIARSGTLQQLTRPGTLVGTMRFMAPELWGGGEAGPLSDQYAMGLVGYAMYSRRLPFAAMNTPREQFEALKKRPTLLSDAVGGFPTTIAAVIDRAISFDPAHRYESADAFADALEDAVNGVGEMQAAPSTEMVPRRVDVIFGGSASGASNADVSGPMAMASSGDVVPVLDGVSAQPTSSGATMLHRPKERRLLVAAVVLAVVALGLGVGLMSAPATTTTATTVATTTTKTPLPTLTPTTPPAPAPTAVDGASDAGVDVDGDGDVGPDDSGDAKAAAEREGAAVDARIAALRNRLRAKGLRGDDVPSIDGAVARARDHRRRGQFSKATTALAAAEKELDGVAVNEAFVRRKVDRFNSALATKAKTHADAHTQMRPAAQKVAASLSSRDFAATNKALNAAFDALEKLPR